MPGCRPDVLKVFLGNLRPDVIKPDILGFMQRRGLDVVDVIVPSRKSDGQAGIAFAVFNSADAAADCINDCHGIEDQVGIGPIQAHRGANMGVFSSC